MKRTPTLLAVVTVLTLSALIAGCTKQPDIRQELQVALEESQALKKDNEGLRAAVVQQAKTIESLRGLGGQERLAKLFHVVDIRVGRYSGGFDLDGKQGDEGIKVFLQPLDRQGSVIKAAAKVKIQLYDLAEAPKDNLIGQYEWDVEDVGSHWSSGFATYHYSFVCPWKSDPPNHNQITVRAEFTDYLTGKTFEAQKLCKIELPPPKTTETKPAKQD